MQLEDIKPAATFVDSIVEKYKPKDAEFDVILPDGETMRFRCITDHGELETMKSGAGDFIKLAMAGKVDAVPAYAGVIVKHPKTLSLAYCVAHLSVNPKLEVPDALRIAKELPYLFDTIIRQVDAFTVYAANSADLEGVEAAKNASDLTSDSGTDS